MEELWGAVFSDGSVPAIYNEDPKPAQRIERFQLQQGIEREFSCGILAGQEGPESGKVKNLHC
jgi:hypothetical protein